MIINDGICVDNNRGWFIGMGMPMLYEVYLPDYSIYPVCMIPNKSGVRERVSQRILYYKENLIILPDRGKSLIILNLNDRKMEEIAIPERFERPCMLNGWVRGNTLYCYMHLNDSIASIDIEKKQFLETERLFGDGKQGAFESTNVGDDLFFISRSDVRICKYNPSKKKKEFYTVDKAAKGFNTILYDSDNKRFYLTGFTEKIYVWSLEHNKASEILIPGGDCSDKENYCFYSSHICGEKAVFLTANYHAEENARLVILDRNSSKLEVVSIAESNGKYQNIIEAVYENKVILLNTNNNELYEIDANNDQIEIIKPKAMRKKNSEKIQGGVIFREDLFTSLEWMVEGVSL